MYPITMGIALALGLFAFALSIAYRGLLLLRAKGRGESRIDRPMERIRGMLVYAFGQKRLLSMDGKSGLMHAFIFWGFLAVGIRTITLFGQGFYADFSLPFMGGLLGYLYVLIKDLFELLVTAGVVALLFRRVVLRPKKLTLSLEANLILAAIGVLMVTDFLMEGAAIARSWHPGAALSPVGMWFAALFTAAELSDASLEKWYAANYFIHTIGILLFLNYLPYGKHFHIITAIPNVFLRRISPAGALSALDLEDEKATTFGVERIGELSWKQTLDLMSCTECGRCSEQCPAVATGKKLDPKELTRALRGELYTKARAIARSKDSAEASGALVPTAIDPQALWDCTTCRACEEACPIFIEYVDKIVDMRRNLVLMKGDLPSEAQVALRNIETNSNPWGIGFASRGDWAAGLGVPTLAEKRDAEYLYFVGCAGSFDERAKRVSRAFVKCMQEAGVSFAILGAEEKCTGDSARRIGNEYLFQTLAKENIATFRKYGVKRIVTACPHCMNTIKNEYPQFGERYEVKSHAEMLRDLLKSGKLSPRNSFHGKTATF
ncbi:MAG TPA: (Fe-S)-binding protein, partial [bacterium]|nr:(Fe-S)-binding protein [bacterium]